MVSAEHGRTPLADVDSAWLRMDDPTNLMVVTGVMVTDTPLTFEEVRDVDLLSSEETAAGCLAEDGTVLRP